MLPEDVRDLRDIERLPFTVKTDLRDTYPFGLFASPMEDVVRLHASSGTTGKPIVVAYTREDLDVWTSVMVRAFAACGLHSRRHRAERLRLRPVHRRAGRALRRRSAGRHGHPHLRRQHRPADHGDEGFRRHRHLLHAQLLPPPAGARRRNWAWTSATCRCASASSAPSRGPNPCAGTSSAKAASRPSTSTAFPRSSGRAWPSSARCQHGPAHLRRPFLPRDRRPGDRRSRCPTARRASWSSPRSASRPCP